MALIPDDVRTYIQDFLEKNHLLDGFEFEDPQIELAMRLAISEYNLIPPISSETEETFPYDSLLMSGILYKLLLGQAALLIRNHMSYSDGNLQIPIEERAQLYESLASMLQQDFQMSARALKAHLNVESGWGEVRSDYAAFPLW
jgi:hypothetical protein